DPDSTGDRRSLAPSWQPGPSHDLAPISGLLGWNGAQERCRHNGGNLAPVRDPGEAERLRELLVAASWLGPAWIGLSLSRGQCTQPQEPLRGFAWAAGGEPGNYSAWLSEPAITCLSSRCVSLRLAGPAGTIGWADRPCRAPPVVYKPAAAPPREGLTGTVLRDGEGVGLNLPARAAPQLCRTSPCLKIVNYKY
uniref:C-type lectin domain-containing protein n=1 Tax=Strix occidentalis caurina TaxID=311401 RepID=A0A8D0KZF7_STROC